MSHPDDDLAGRYFDQALSVAELADLELRLLSDPAAADRFAVQCRFEADLAACFGVAGEQRKAEGLGLTASNSARSKRREWWVAGAAALLGLSLCGYWLLAQMRGGNPVARSAEVVSGHVLAGSTSPKTLALDRAFRAEERSEIALPDGSRATLEPEASMVLRRVSAGERQSVEVLEGKVGFTVAKAPGAFWVRTVAGSVKVVGTEFSVELLKTPANNMESENSTKGAGAMKLSTVLLVVVASGLVEVNVGGVTYNLSGGQSRAFAEEGGKDRPKKEGEKNRPHAIGGEISAVSGDSITLNVKGDGGIRSETVAITPATVIGIQAGEDETRLTDGGKEVRIPKMVDGTAADLRVGERAYVNVNDAGQALRITQLRRPARKEGDAKREGDAPVRKAEGEPRREGDGVKKVDGERKAEPVKKFEGEPRREGDGVKKVDGERKSEPVKKFEGEPRREGDGVKKVDGERKSEPVKKFEGEPRREGDGVKKVDGERKAEPVKKFEGDRKREGDTTRKDGTKDGREDAPPASKVKPSNDL